ncbi:DNA/RNA helicase, superfamily II, SNF2 family (plasmid) [Methanomethylovorans hollandica DSM 15978]|uniref:DNA/RNA helicase, superfamily II, SNF2 family n=1 Tax=Methanomethylovorans hollandica (strain DSM 15978 / NBRC 107637 / DMS1) TaxID=867904 RepID=L0L0C0_METHD|nr:DNA/RNA helicase, superfamily II, SNF2 family [Methanomethylovorans hollandica DSM 15978]
MLQTTLIEFLDQISSNPILPKSDLIPEPITEEIKSILRTISPDDPNYRIFEMQESRTLTREYALHKYKPLGLTVKLEGSRGLPDMHKKRELNKGQFFTPAVVVKALTESMGLDRAKNLTIMDNSMGIGSMFQFIPNNNRLYGIELDNNAFSIAKYIWPNDTIINDNLINHTSFKHGAIPENDRYLLTSKERTMVDAFIINPPFSLQIEKKNIPLINANWGKLGPRSSIESHIAALEIALESSRTVVGAILPTSFFTNSSTYSFEKWASIQHKKLLRIDLPSEAFKEYGTEWNCSLVVYIPYDYWYNKLETMHLTVETMEQLPEKIEIWKNSEGYKKLLEKIDTANEYPLYDLDLQPHAEIESISVPSKPTLSLEYAKKIRISVNANSSGLVFSAKDMLSALKLQEAIDSYGKKYNRGNQTNFSIWQWNCRRMNIVNDGLDTIMQMKEHLERKGLDVVFDDQVFNWYKKITQRKELEMTPFEKAVYDEDKGIWINKYSENGIRTKYAAKYEELHKKLDKLGIDWLWPYQKDDVIRMCMKSGVMYTGDMGVGKTRCIIASIILSGHEHALIVVESRNIKEFLTEFNNLGIKNVNVIDSRKELDNLKQFNIISYNKLWTKIDGLKKPYIKVLKKKIKFVAFDEAHNLKAADSNRSLAARQMFGRCKRIIEATGTIINNYPRNIFSLLVAAWGDGTELNPYGYRYPVDEGYQFTSGTRKFNETFIKTTWVSEQFAQTLDKGMRSMEVPMVKDINEWYKMLAPKMIRRVTNEPEVKPYMKCPTPVFHNHLIKPDTDHLLYYKKWLENYAKWFREQLEIMKYDSSHNISNAIVISHLTKLQFASTIPQSSKTDIPGFEWNHDSTQKQIKTIELIRNAINNGEKIIVFSERPEFLSYMHRILNQEQINSILFTGEISIDKRITDKEKFQTSPDINVMLATTTCGETALNIPEASTVIVVDVNWTPSKTRQAYSRILRPQQKKEPNIHFVLLEGTIDEYMKQLCDLKANGIDQAIDEKKVSEFNPDNWLSYKDFSYKMLTEEGLL